MKQISNGLDRSIKFKKSNILFVVLFSLFGFLAAIWQIFGVSRDYLSYDDFFDLARWEGMDMLVKSRFELGFVTFSVFLTALFASNLIVYGWIVAFAMLLKGWAIKIISSGNQIFLIVSAFYLSRYFPLHELTQLRVAFAIALIMVGAIFLWKEKLLYGLLICASSLLFHMSAATIIPALLLPSYKRWQVMLIATFVFVFTSIFASAVTTYLAEHILILNAYQTYGFHETKPKPFSISLMIDLGMIIFALVKWSRLTSLMKRIILLELIGMAFYYGLIEFGVIAHRLRELFSVFWIFFIAEGLIIKETKNACFGFAFICIFFYSYLFIISGDFFQ